jgi:hypothetical protein
VLFLASVGDISAGKFSVGKQVTEKLKKKKY